MIPERAGGTVPWPPRISNGDEDIEMQGAQAQRPFLYIFSPSLLDYWFRFQQQIG